MMSTICSICGSSMTQAGEGTAACLACECAGLHELIEYLEAIMKDEELDRLLDMLQWPEKRTDTAAVRERIHGRFAAAIAGALAPRDVAIKRVMAICESPDEPLEWSKAILDALGGCWADSADPAERMLGALEWLAKMGHHIYLGVGNGQLHVYEEKDGLDTLMFYWLGNRRLTRAEALALLRKEKADGKPES